MSKISAVAGSSIYANIIGTLTLLATVFSAYLASQTQLRTKVAPMATDVPHSALLVLAAVIGIGLLLPSWIALFRSFGSSSTSNDNVESPLKRLPNGALDWKPIQYEQIANKPFLNAEVPLDGRRYINCTFRHCTFVYEGTAPTEIVENCQLIRQTQEQPNFAIKSGNPIVITALVLAARISQGGAGIAGVRFEPTPN